MASTPLGILESIFGYTSFRDRQEVIIQTILKREDVFVLMPTGGGKSLCYQIPALLLPGLTVVVSPLIALMKDQVDALRISGVSAAYLNSSQSIDERTVIFNELAAGKLKLLYVSPERLMNENSGLIAFLKNKSKVSLFAIDEAHCISHWGHDFRPEYRTLFRLKQDFFGVPVAAFTATADKVTREDVIKKLGLHNPKIFISSFNRANIQYHVRPKRQVFSHVVDYVMRHPDDAGIVYTLSRKSAEDVAERLRGEGFSARAYHAGLSPETRADHQELFLHDKVNIMVATIAFGMGINKSNVRFVIHVDLPKNIESYYQETGRAGRDGLPSDAILFYSSGDVAKLKRFAAVEGNSAQTALMVKKLEQLAALCEAHACRRQALLTYFGEENIPACTGCDVCLSNYERFDGTIIAQKALSAVARLEQQHTVEYVVDFLRGSQSEKIIEAHRALKTYGVGAEIRKEEWLLYFKQLRALGYVAESRDSISRLKLTEKSEAVLRGLEKVFLVHALSKKEVDKENKEYEEELFHELKQLRAECAAKENVPAYIVFSDATLREMATYLPHTMSELGAISGFGKVKLERYGTRFLEKVVEYAQKKKLSSRMKEKSMGEKKVAQEKISDSGRRSLELFKQGNSLSEIALLRSLSLSTVEGHVARFLATGEVAIQELVDATKVALIEKALAGWSGNGLASLKEVVGEEVSYGELRAVLAWQKKNIAQE